MTESPSAAAGALSVAPVPSSAPTSKEDAHRIVRLLKKTSRVPRLGDAGAAGRRADAAALDELRRTFGRLHSLYGRAAIDGGGGAGCAEGKYLAFLCAKHREFEAALTGRLSARDGDGDGDGGGGAHHPYRYALRTALGVLAYRSSPEFDGTWLTDVVRASARAAPGHFVPVGPAAAKEGGSGSALLSILVRDGLDPYADVREGALRAVREIVREIIAQEEQSGAGAGDDGDSDGARERRIEAADHLVKILIAVGVPTAEEDEHFWTGGEEGGSSVTCLCPSSLRAIVTAAAADADDGGDDNDAEQPKHAKPATPASDEVAFCAALRAAHTSAWSAALSLRRHDLLSPPSVRLILRHAPTGILGRIAAGSALPLLAQFFAETYGGTSSARGSPAHSVLVPLLALHGTHLLVTRHGLSRPDFYPALYALVTPASFHARCRTRFLRLLAQCLRSDRLPLHVAAAFAKRIARCALAVPPAGTLFCVAMVSNLVRRFPGIAALVHRTGGGGDGLKDVYDDGTDDPAKSRAIDSSLWEIAALSRHYHPVIAALAGVVGREDDTTPLHDMEDFLAHSHTSIFDAETKRGNAKRRAPLAFKKPDGLFVEGDVFCGLLDVPKRAKGAEGETLQTSS